MTDLSPPQQRRSQDTLEAISAATWKLLRTRSFKELKIQDIVDEANSSTGSFYARFKGKRALLHYLHEEWATTSLASLRAYIEAAEIDKITPQELAQQLVPTMVASHIESRGILRATLVESLDDPQFIKRAMGFFQSTARLLAEHTTPTAKSKDQHIVNVQQALGAVIAILDQSLFSDKSSAPRISDAEVARLQRIFLASLDVRGQR